MKVVLVATSAGTLKGGETGVWLEELASPYYEFEAANAEIIIASPAGGPIPIDAGSISGAYFSETAKKFLHDAKAVGKLCHSTPLSDIDFSSGIDAMFMCGGHGTAVDFIDNPTLKAAIETMYNGGKIVSAVCHGPVCLVDCVKADGTPLVQGLNVTVFSDAEEEMAQMVDKVPFLVETRFHELGAKYSKATDAWHPHVCADGNLVTGQNPASSTGVAQKVISMLTAE